MITVEAMQTRWVLLVCSLAACGGGGSSGKEKQVCEHAAKLCDAEDDLASCPGDLAKVKKTMGDQYGKFLDCSLAAKSCGEYVGCAIGGLGNEALDQLDGFGQGMKKMMKDKIDDFGEKLKSEIRDIDGDDKLPAVCQRIEKVCSKDQPFIRKECRTLVENLGVDKAHLAELASCIDASDSCFALEKCVDSMEDKMRGH